MEFELSHVSPAGAALAALAGQHAADFAAAADRHDRDGTFPFGHWEELRRSGFLASTVPPGLGGLGVTDIGDLVVAISRLARGDPAVAIGAAMHTTAFWYLARLLADQSAAPGDERFTSGLRLLLRRCARGRVVACVSISETGTSLGNPRTVAEPGPDGYLISGKKTFCTNSPAATIFLCSVRIPAPGAGDRLGFALVPRETEGVTVRDNWDALGMRASGSGEVSFSSCRVPRTLVTEAGPIGVLSERLLPLTMGGVLVQAAAFLGVAEQAHAVALASVRASRPGPGQPAAGTRGVVQATLGESEADLAASRGVLARTAAVLGDGLPPGDPGPAGLPGLMKEVQCANMVVKRAAIAIVDRSLTATGGRGYLSSSVLSRLYRDVRAGPFMQPFSVLDAFEYIGRVALGAGQEGLGMTNTADGIAESPGSQA